MTRVLIFLALLASAGVGSRPAVAEPPASPAPQLTAQSVLGPDGREEITGTSVFPFSAIAYLELLDIDGDVLGSCSGTFIGADVVLTAGHCLWDAEAGDWLPWDVRVVPGKTGDFEPFGSELATDWWVPDAYTEFGSDDWDWGVVKLPDDLLTLDTGWLPVAVAPTDALESPGFNPVIVGYPGDKPEGTMWAMSAPAFQEVDPFHLFYDIDTAAGQSGSAIWSGAEGPYQFRIVGIHTSGGELNSGSRIDEELLDDLLHACDVMGCAIDVEGPVLPQLPFHSYGVALARD